jgi:oligopeptide/dipeptide ABC transporter ATP-binding protein
MTTHHDTSAPAPVPKQLLLQVDNLVKHFPLPRGLFKRDHAVVHAVDDVSFKLAAGETMAVVGESGCGKSTLGRLLLRLLEPTSGQVWFNGKHLTILPEAMMRAQRRELQMIFQDPYSSLNPRMTIAQTLTEPLHLHGLAVGRQRERAAELLELVGLAPQYLQRYPHEFSGGQRQRIGIARAIALRPKLIVCDEPVSALDVSIQAQVVNLLEDLQDEFRLAYIFIAHDLSVVRHISDRIAVMYLGRIMELAESERIYKAPLHPYTHALTSAVPLPDPRAERSRERILLHGDLPSPINPPSGCVFRTRCPKAQDRCAQEIPVLRELAPGHYGACHFPEERHLI